MSQILGEREEGYHPTLRVLRVDGIKRKREMYYVEVNRMEEIISFLENLPLLINKRPHAQLIREYCKSRLDNSHKSYSQRELELTREVRALNALHKGLVGGQ